MAEGDLQAYLAKAQQVYTSAVAIMKDMHGWTKIKEKHEVVSYTRPTEGTDLFTFKAELYVNKPPAYVSRYLFDNWETLNKDLQPEDIESFTILNQINENVKTVHIKITPKGPVSARDGTGVTVFLDLGNDTFAFVSTGVECGIPPQQGYVRADMKVGFHLFEPVAGDASRTHIVAITLLDPKGSVPAMIVNAILLRRGKTYELLQEQINNS
jgi:hypothetical protein